MNFFFWKAIKIAGSAHKNRVGRVSGNTGMFLRPKGPSHVYGLVSVAQIARKKLMP